MTVRDLELFATEELIEEILRRSSFQGVVIHAREPADNRPGPADRAFRVCFNSNFETEEVGRLLDRVSRRLDAA